MRRVLLMSPKQIRNMYLMEIRDILVNESRRIFQADLQQQIDLLAEENANLLFSTTPTFTYRGKRYAASWHQNLPGIENVQIHPSMLEKISKVLDSNDFDAVISEGRIKNFMDNVLLFAGHIDDLVKILPGRLHHVLVNINADIYNVRNPATPDQIEQFKTKNKSGLVEFNKLFLEDLLMS